MAGLTCQTWRMTDTRHDTRRTVSWGEALVVEAFKYPGGLRSAVDAIRAEVGPYIGTRNTFAKLLKANGPDELGEVDQFRAWLLISAFGKFPEDWGIPNAVVPRSMDWAKLQAELRQRRATPLGRPTSANAGTTRDGTGTTRSYSEEKSDGILRKPTKKPTIARAA